MAQILVTGAAGFIGSHTVDLLLSEGHSVIGVDNFRTGRRQNLLAAQRSKEFSFHEADVAEESVLDGVVGAIRPAAIIHLAALVSVQESIADPRLNFRLNVAATHLIAETARRHGVPRVVFASSAAIYGDATELPIREAAEKKPISPYGAAKLASESLLLGHAAAYGFTVRCQRYFNVYGTRQDPASPYSGVISIFERCYRAGKSPTIFGDGQQTRDFVAVRDVARCNVLAATQPALASGAVNICTGRPTSLLEVAEVFSKHFPGTPVPTLAPARAGDIRQSLGAPALAATELDFLATTSVADGLAELIEGSADTR